MQYEDTKTPSIVSGPWTDVRDGLKYHAMVFEEVHHLLARRPIPKLSVQYDLDEILNRISPACTTLKSASLITHSLLNYIRSKKILLTALRATRVNFFGDKKSWPLIEWTEDDGTYMMAVFHFDELRKLEDASWVMHSGHKASNKQGWQKSRIDWNVAEIGHLKILFGVVGHMLGLLEWPVADALGLFFGNPTTCSVTE